MTATEDLAHAWLTAAVVLAQWAAWVSGTMPYAAKGRVEPEAARENWSEEEPRAGECLPASPAGPAWWSLRPTGLLVQGFRCPPGSKVPTPPPASSSEASLLYFGAVPVS